jgi:hypothetical protein
MMTETRSRTTVGAQAQLPESQQLQFNASPTSGRAPLPASFSYAYTSDNSTWMMDVDFDDGSTGKLQPPHPRPCAKNPSGLAVADCPITGAWRGAHMYASAGTYTATLTRGGLPLCFTCKAPVLGAVTITVTAPAL